MGCRESCKCSNCCSCIKQKRGWIATGLPSVDRMDGKRSDLKSQERSDLEESMWCAQAGRGRQKEICYPVIKFAIVFKKSVQSYFLYNS
jgi:hypothetical protein